jgi:hypothetical protein
LFEHGLIIKVVWIKIDMTAFDEKARLQNVKMNSKKKRMPSLKERGT